MGQVLQFTIDQVADQLDLSESVVQRLSQAFNIPGRYYQPEPGQPRLYLYNPTEVRLLQQAQQFLLSGYTLPQVKQIFDTQSPLEPSAEDLHPSLEDLDTQDDLTDETDLQEYEEASQMKRHLAQSTFRQYLHQNKSAYAPFKSLAQKFQADRERHSGMQPPVKQNAHMSLPEPLLQPELFRSSQPFQQQHSGQSASSLPLQSWMTPELKNRAAQLQQELTLNFS